jgi:AcrR family transcriptional regulator
MATVDHRAHLIEVAARILEREGPGAVTTRSVAEAAGVQAPAIYRLFGDKTGLLRAVVDDAIARHVAAKDPDAEVDPVHGLRVGWDVQLDFGLAHPALFRLSHAMEPSPGARDTIEAGRAVLAARVHRVALAGRLAVPERRAVDLIIAAGTGVVFALIAVPDADRDPGLGDAVWRSIAAAILVDGPDPVVGGPAAAAVALRASLPGIEALTPSERALMGEWLDRIAGG